MTEEAVEDTRTCHCHPDDNPPVPCPRKFALNTCRHADLLRDMTECYEEWEVDGGDVRRWIGKLEKILA